MKYANIFFDGNRTGSVNLGDDLQLHAITNLYNEMGVDKKNIVRIGLSELSEYDGEYVILPVSFPLYGYRRGLNITCFSSKIIPVFLGLSIMSPNISEEEKIYLRRFEPIGCRDKYTMELLRKNNIMAYVGGCQTALFPRRKENISSNKVYIIDIPNSFMKYIPDELKENAVIDSQIKENCKNPEQSAIDMLEEYRANAKMIITTRLHCALPCIASGIPVIVMKESYSFRFTTLNKYVHIYTKDEFENIEWNAKSIDYELEKRKMIKFATDRISQNFDKYANMFDISYKYENEETIEKVYIEHYNNVIENLEDYISEFGVPSKYAIWGITQKSDMVCNYMEEKYPQAKLAVVYDRNKCVMFHGLMSTSDSSKLLDLETYVFVTAATANRYAVELFENAGKKNYNISDDGIVIVSKECKI